VKMQGILASAAAVALVVALARPTTVDAQSGSELESRCAACHTLTKPANASVDRLWERKGPDLWYAGNKFNRAWLVQWLQKPTPIRPGGVLWFKHAKPGEPRDTLDPAAAGQHPAVDAATAAKLADELLTLKADGLVAEGAFKPEGVNLTMGQMSFGKLRGCVACHQDKAGQGGLSGPALIDAGQRLQPDYVLAYMKDPQQFDRYVWMPRVALSDADLQRLTGYVVSLGKENN